MSETRRARAFAPHPLRERVLNEIHARPFQVMRPPRVILHYAFMTDGAAGDAALEALTERCLRLGVRPPAHGDRHHIVEIGDARLRFEVHTEFTTYSVDAPRPTLSTVCQLRKYGVRFGAFNIFFPALVKPAATDLASALWSERPAGARIDVAGTRQ